LLFSEDAFPDASLPEQPAPPPAPDPPVDFVNNRSITKLNPANCAESALCESFPSSHRREQVEAYIKRNEILLNRKGGLRRLSPEERRDSLEELAPLFSHFPYQVLDFCFRELPRATYHNHRETVSQSQLQSAVTSWMDRFPHTKEQVRAWVGVVRKQRDAALVNASPGRPLRVGRNAVNAARAIYLKLQQPPEVTDESKRLFD
jgi:hypothetical protein